MEEYIGKEVILCVGPIEYYGTLRRWGRQYSVEDDFGERHIFDEEEVEIVTQDEDDGITIWLLWEDVTSKLHRNLGKEAVLFDVDEELISGILKQVYIVEDGYGSYELVDPKDVHHVENVDGEVHIVLNA